MTNGKLTVTCITRELGPADVGVTGDVMPACFCTRHVDNYVLNVTHVNIITLDASTNR